MTIPHAHLTIEESSEFERRILFFQQWVEVLKQRFPDQVFDQGSAYLGFVAGIWYIKNPEKVQPDGKYEIGEVS